MGLETRFGQSLRYFFHPNTHHITMKTFKSLLLFSVINTLSLLALQAQPIVTPISPPIQSWTDKLDGVTIEALPCTKVTFGDGVNSPFLKAEFDPQRRNCTAQQVQQQVYGIRFTIQPNQNKQLAHVEMDKFQPKQADQSFEIIEKHTLSNGISYWSNEKMTSNGRTIRFLKEARPNQLVQDSNIPNIYFTFANYPQNSTYSSSNNRYCALSATTLATIQPHLYSRLQSECNSTNSQQPRLIPPRSIQQRANQNGSIASGNTNSTLADDDSDSEADSYINGKQDGTGKPPPLTGGGGRLNPNWLNYFYMYSPADANGNKMYSNQSRRTVVTEMRAKGVPITLKTKPTQCSNGESSSTNSTIPPCPPSDQ